MESGIYMDIKDSALDNNDIEILRLLQKEGRASYSEISRQLGIPQSTVRFKVNKLIKEGYIRRFVALLDPVKLGYPLVVIMLLKARPSDVDRIFDYISSFSELHHMFQITGKYDFIVILHARDMDHVRELNNKIRNLEGILDAETLLATGKLVVKTELNI